MALTLATLQSDIQKAFDAAKTTPPPADPNDSDKVQEQIVAKLSTDLANAINAFVTSAEVGGVTVSVIDKGPGLASPGTQVGTVKLK